MKHAEGRLRGHKNLNLYYQCWLPSRKTKAILLVAHSLFEHSGRYINLANYFVPKDYAVFGLDHRGHGKSEGLRGYVERFQDYLDDLQTFVNIIRGQHSDTKIFLVGHGMGGLIATAYTVHHQHELSGTLLSSPALKVTANLSPVLRTTVPLLSTLFPKMGATALDASALSQDQAIVDDYLNDPLVYKGKISMRLEAEMIKAAEKLPPQMPWIHLPTLIMHGTADRLFDLEGSQMLHEQVASKDKTLKLYEDFYHEIFNEPGHEQVFADMEAWLTAHI